MRILYFGSGEFAIPTLRSIAEDGHEIVAVVTQPDRPRGRGKETMPTPVKSAAIDLGHSVLATEDVNSPDMTTRLKSLGADLAYVAAFGQKIGKELLTAFPVGIVNLHASLLPALRGAAPINWAIINGDAETGVTVFRLVEKMDAGPILMQRRTGIGDVETADELHDRLARIGCDAVRATLELLAAQPDTPGTPQDVSKATIAPKLSKADGHLRFDQPTKQLAHRVCGLWSWPGATCRYRSADGRRDEIVTVARARPYEGRTNLAGADEAGRITDVLSIQTADGELEILEIKPAGGRLMSWQDFVNGRHVAAGDRLISIESEGSRPGGAN
jgi:methionyl-tRNA formyltransferase